MEHSEFRLIFTVIVRQLTHTEHRRSRYNLWCLIFSLPSLLLSLPPGRNDRNDKQTTAQVFRDRLTLFFDGEFDELYNGYVNIIRELSRSSSIATNSNPDAASRAAISIIKGTGDLSRAARRLESTATIADYNDPLVQEKVAELLIDNRPNQDFITASEACKADVFNNPCPQFESGDVQRAVSNLSNSACGITGWHASHFKVIAETPDGLNALTYVVNEIFKAEVPDSLFEGLTSSILLPLQKEDGGIRPILIGDTFVRLIGKCVTQLEQRTIAKKLEPLQTAVGVKSGIEVSIHGIRAHLDAHPNHVAITVDFKNAFGTIKREVIADALNQFGYNDTKYNRWFHNHFGAGASRVVPSNGEPFYYSEGVPQGGPTSMQNYCLASHSLLHDVNKTLAPVGGVIIAYADDIVILAEPEAAFNAFALLRNSSVAYGLQPRPQKCKVLALTPELKQQCLPMALHHGICPEMKDALVILGTPIGTQAAEAELAEDITGSDIFTPLTWIGDIQCRLLLLRYCISTKFLHFSRTLPPDVSMRCLAWLESQSEAALATMLDYNKLPDETWKEATLPLSFGGLGLKQMVKQAKHDYYASAATALLYWRNVLDKDHPTLLSFKNISTRSAANLADALHACHIMTKDYFDHPIVADKVNDPAEPEHHLPARKPYHLPKTVPDLLTGKTPDQTKLQSALSITYNYTVFRDVWRRIPKTDAHRAQMLAKTTGTPSLVFNVIPTEPGLVLSNIEMKMTMCQYLSLPLEPLLRVPADPKHAIACCCRPLGSKKPREICHGNHLFNCKREDAFLKRHNAILDVVAKAFKAVYITPAVERRVQTVAKIGKKNNRLSLKRFDISAAPADSDSKTLCLDITVSSHTTKEYLVRYGVNKPLYSISNAITTKRKKYFAQVQHETEVFVPLVCETTGAIHHNYQKLYEHLANRVNGLPPVQANWAAPTFASYWMQRTSVVLWRETARALLRLAAESARVAAFPRGAAKVSLETVEDVLGTKLANKLASAPAQEDENDDVINISEDSDDQDLSQAAESSSG